MKKNIMILFIALMLVSVCARAEKVPSIGDEMFQNAKQALVYCDSGDYESAASLIDCADSNELEKFFNGNYLTIGLGVQTQVSVAYWVGSSWELAVPLSEPDDDKTEVFILLTDDGESFSGYQFATWDKVEEEYSACDYVVWNEEYVPASPFLISD